MTPNAIILGDCIDVLTGLEAAKRIHGPLFANESARRKENGNASNIIMV